MNIFMDRRENILLYVQYTLTTKQSLHRQRCQHRKTAAVVIRGIKLVLENSTTVLGAVEYFPDNGARFYSFMSDLSLCLFLSFLLCHLLICMFISFDGCLFVSFFLTVLFISFFLSFFCSQLLCHLYLCLFDFLCYLHTVVFIFLSFFVTYRFIFFL